MNVAPRSCAEVLIDSIPDDWAEANPLLRKIALARGRARVRSADLRGMTYEDVEQYAMAVFAQEFAIAVEGLPQTPRLDCLRAETLAGFMAEYEEQTPRDGAEEQK